MGYVVNMPDHNLRSSDSLSLAPKRRAVAMRLLEIEGNPLTPEDIAMFEMFDREGWSHERRRAYIIAKALPLAAE
jgi:hypothetical protein